MDLIANQRAALQSFESNGRVWLRNALTQTTLREIEEQSSTNQRPGIRLKLDAARLKLFGPQSELGIKVANFLPGAFPVRIVAFDKSEGNNWSLPWHQDRVISTKNRAMVSGFSNWSRKDGCWHCEPPTSLLERMAFVRIHLDDCSAENGAMELALGSHKSGFIRADDATIVASSLPKEKCTALRGDVLILKMLTVHRSITANHVAHRRTIRIDYAAEKLPMPLEWAYNGC